MFKVYNKCLGMWWVNVENVFQKHDLIKRNENNLLGRVVKRWNCDTASLMAFNFTLQTLLYRFYVKLSKALIEEQR